MPKPETIVTSLPTSSSEALLTNSRMEHIPSLDGLRGIAILLAALTHWYLPPISTPTHAERVVGYLFVYSGYAGVILFFSLSGYLITRLLILAQPSEHYYRDFYARRALRLLPAYYLVIGLVILMAPRHTADAILTHWKSVFFYTSNITIAISGFAAFPGVAHIWSLALEEQFYLFWPFLVKHLRPLGPYTIALAVIGVAIRSYLMFHTSVFYVGYVLPFSQLDSLCLGAFLALIPMSTLRRFRDLWLLLAMLGVLIYVSRLFLHPVRWTPAHGAALGRVWLAVAAGCLVAHSLLCRGLYVWRPLRYLGRHAYAIYLVNLPLRPALDAVLGSRIYSWPCSQLIYIAISLALDVVCAALIWRYVEAPALRFRTRFQ